MNIKIQHRFTGRIMLSGEFDSVKECVEKNKNLTGANLPGANLPGANLSGANLSGTDLTKTNLSGADLHNIIHYKTSHDIFIQLVKNNLVKFTKRQREVACCIFTFRLCWDTIRKKYKKEAGEIFTILAKLGWGEYKEVW